MPKRDKNAAINERLTSIHNELVEKRVQYHRAYHPISVGGVKSSSSSRQCDDRWAYVREGLIETGSKSLIDFGCAEGFFVRKASEEGYFALGIDNSTLRLGLAEEVRLLDKVERCGFVLSAIEPKLLQCLPQFDCVLCFSVLHHIIKRQSLDNARNVLALMRPLTKKVLFFDIAQPEEHKGWSDVLSFMGDKPDIWIKSFLEEAGFENPEVLGTISGVKGQGDRFLFRCII